MGLTPLKITSIVKNFYRIQLQSTDVKADFGYNRVLTVMLAC